jgi:hypothetical protein
MAVQERAGAVRPIIGIGCAKLSPLALGSRNGTLRKARFIALSSSSARTQKGFHLFI